MWTSSELLNLILAQLWQVTAVAVLVTLVCQLLRIWRCHPAMANLLWLLVLAKALTPPLWASPVGVFSWSFNQSFIPLSGSSDTTMGLLGGYSSALVLLIGTLWGIGFTATVLSHIANYRRLLRHIEATQQAVDPTLVGRVERLSQSLGFRNSPPLVVTSTNLGPALAGIWKPRIILPAQLLQSASWKEVEPIVVHELLHLRRRDTAISVIQVLVNAIWWFHPLIRWAGKQIDEASERCVDLAVLQFTGCDPATYCRSLLNVLESRCEAAQGLLMAAPAARGVSFTRDRVRELIEAPPRPGLLKQLTSIVSVGALAFVLLPGRPLSALQPSILPGFEPCGKESFNDTAVVDSKASASALFTTEVSENRNPYRHP